MAVVGLSFGSATSGDGFDVTTTVASIMTNMRTPEVAWAARTTVLEAQDTALSALGTDLSTLASALATLTASDDAFAQKSGATSNTDAVTLTGATSSAVAGSHVLTVQQLATTSQLHSSAVATSASLSGTLTFQVGTGTTQSITLDSSNNTMTGLASAINALDAGVYATVISDGSGSRLSLTSATSGAGGDVSIDTSGLTDSDGTAVDMVKTRTGVDAEYTLDGISLTSTTNSITSVLPGVTFQLLGTTTSDVTLEIANDLSSIATSLTTLVDAYNSVISAMAEQEGKDSSGNAMPLYGDQTLAQLQTQLAAALLFLGGNSSEMSLSELGISVDQSGTMSLDTTALSRALSGDFLEAAAFFQTMGNFGQNMITVLTGMGSGTTGAIGLRTAQNTAEEEILEENTTRLEDRLEAYETRLTAELTAANQVLQSIPQQIDEINQIFDAISGYNRD